MDEYRDLTAQEKSFLRATVRPISKPERRGGGVIFTLMIGFLFGMGLAVLAFAEPLMTAHNAARIEAGQ